MKAILISTVLAIISIGLNAQTATSVANGSWNMPTTWDCMCVPSPGYTVVINHSVTIPNDFAISSGSITIGSAGNLGQSGGDFGLAVFSGGSINVQGSFSMSKLMISGGNISNTGSITGLDSLYIDAIFDNQGSIDAANFYASNDFANEGPVICDNFFNDAGCINYSSIETYNFTNNHIFENYGEIIFADAVNIGEINNKNDINSTHDFLNMGDLYNVTDTSAIIVYNNFQNRDSIQHDAYLLNNGNITVLNNFSNGDTITGSGNFCVGQLSSNTGNMDGTFEFCDNTPPAMAPFIDSNTGFIGSNITWCSGPCLSAIADHSEPLWTLFPNPASEWLQISGVAESQVWQLLTAGGQIVLNGVCNDNSISIDISHLPAGTYMISVYAGIDRQFRIFTIE